MFHKLIQWKKTIYLGISIKLFIAFWLAITLSLLISYLVTTQFRQNPTQETANLKQLKLLSQFSNNLHKKNKVQLQTSQHKFYKRTGQYLLIKNLGTKKVNVPRKRVWSKVRNYLESHSLENPITIDFSFTQVTSSKPIRINGKNFQLFIASEIKSGFAMEIMRQLPVTLRFLFLITISFLCCWLLAKSFSSPLIAIQKATKDIGMGKLTTRIQQFDERSDEFGDLAKSFNQMAEQLESNMTAHQRLLADVSHELRSPLTRLQLAVALAEKNKGNDEEQQKHLTRCETEVERLDEMIADVLTLSRLEHNHSIFSANELHLTSLIEQVINDCQYFATSKNISIALQGEMPEPLFADNKLLSSAISNVINNAVKYSPKDKVVSVELTQQKNQVKLTISDSGAGVPNEMLTKLFSPFFRVADARERSSGGTGLGLAIAQQAIKLHQGEIFAENIKDGGFKVTILLPTSN